LGTFAHEASAFWTILRRLTILVPAECAILLIREGDPRARPALTQADGERGVQAEDFHDSVRPGLIAMLPRLKRFADVLVGERDEGASLLGRALQAMLAEQHRYQRGTALDVWSFGEIYRHWLHELRDHANPVVQTKIDDARFGALFHAEQDGYLDAPVIAFLKSLPPQQRLTLLLVYGEGFDHESAGRVLDVAPDTIAARLVRISAGLADRLGDRVPAQAPAIVEPLYPEGLSP
jgi:DNA-directed RNA polymerase specialized sigma24 family protein